MLSVSSALRNGVRRCMKSRYLIRNRSVKFGGRRTGKREEMRKITITIPKDEMLVITDIELPDKLKGFRFRSEG
jgi:hypothetical protein